MPTTIGYTDVETLASNLEIPNPTPEETAGMVRALTEAYVEILSEIDIGTDDLPLSTDEEALAAGVQLDRANEHWQQEKQGFGLIGIGDTGAIYSARDSWDRHALKLAPLKRSWGFA